VRSGCYMLATETPPIGTAPIGAHRHHVAASMGSLHSWSSIHLLNMVVQHRGRIRG
jgi:hypothetical protein